MEEKIFKEILKERAQSINVFLNEEELNQFYQYKELVLEWKN